MKNVVHTLFVFTFSLSTSTVHAVLNATVVRNDGIKLHDSNGGGTGFGVSVHMNKEWLAVGGYLDDVDSRQDQGTVSLYRLNRGIQSNSTATRSPKNAEGAGTRLGIIFSKKLLAPDGEKDDHFGISVAVDSGFLIIGSDGDDPSSFPIAVGNTGESRSNETRANQGSAYIYRDGGVNWMYQQKITAHDGERGDRFGCAISVHKSFAVIGAMWDDDKADDSGSVYVFRSDGNSWVEQQKIVPTCLTTGDYFGSTVTIYGDYFAAGTRYHDINGVVNSGTVYVFKRDKYTGQWNFDTKLWAPNPTRLGYFGSSVSMYQLRIAVGECGDISNKGSVYTYIKNGWYWELEQKLLASDGEANHRFGCSVSIQGETVIVGADGYHSDSGVVYVFRLADGAWVEVAKLNARDGNAEDKFGSYIALVNRTAAIKSISDSGSIYFFDEI